MKNNPFYEYISCYRQNLLDAQAISLQNATPETAKETLKTERPALIFAPHPDDECIIGALPLRLLREQKRQVINVAVTLGSLQKRRQERWKELNNACNSLGFDLIQTAPEGLEKINRKAAAEDPDGWIRSVDVIHKILTKHNPSILFFPHDADWNITHIGTHDLVIQALQKMDDDFSCSLIETEFWGQNKSPNLMVESSVEDVADLVAALALHLGEVERNPYHLLLPPWMMNNVRSGSELVGGQGKAAPNFTFATLYALSTWHHGAQHLFNDFPAYLATGDDLSWLFTQ